MTSGPVEVITSVQRRRRWSTAEKERLVAASLAPGAVASEVARAAGIHPSQLFGWRRQMCVRRADAAGFAAVRLADTASALVPAPGTAAGTIEVEFAGGTRLRISGAVDAQVVSAVMRSLAKGAGRR
jgi:transposase